MHQALSYLLTQISAARNRIAATRDDGYSTEFILATALVVVLTLAVVGIIVTKVTAKANSIDLGP
jgi:hypothetical protein